MGGQLHSRTTRSATDKYIKSFKVDYPSPIDEKTQSNQRSLYLLRLLAETEGFRCLREEESLLQCMKGMRGYSPLRLLYQTIENPKELTSGKALIEFRASRGLQDEPTEDPANLVLELILSYVVVGQFSCIQQPVADFRKCLVDCFDLHTVDEQKGLVNSIMMDVYSLSKEEMEGCQLELCKDVSKAKQWLIKCCPSEPSRLWDFKNTFCSLKEILLEDLEVPQELNNLADCFKSLLKLQAGRDELETCLFGQKPGLAGYNFFPFMYGLSVGTLFLDGDRLLTRKKRAVIQVYIGSQRAILLSVDPVVEVVLKDSERCTKGALPVLNWLQRKLLVDGEELESDYDMIAVRECNSRYYYLSNKQTWAEFLEEDEAKANINCRIYFVQQTDSLSSSKVRIIIKAHRKHDSTNTWSFLQVLEETDTLEALVESIRDLSDETMHIIDDQVIDEALRNMLASTHSCLYGKSLLEARALSKEIGFNRSTSIQAILEKVRKEDSCFEKSKQIIDLVLFFEFQGPNESIFIPKYIQSSTSNCLEINLSLDSIVDLTCNPGCCTVKKLSETELRRYLPNYLYCSISTVKNRLELPTKLALGFLRDAIQQTDTHLNHKYSPVAFIAHKQDGSLYLLRAEGEKEQKGILTLRKDKGGEMLITFQDPLKVSKVIGVFLQRSEAEK